MAAELLNADETVSLGNAVRALSQGWRSIATWALGALLLGLALALLLPNKYTAVGTLLPPTESGAGGGVGGFSSGGATIVSLGLSNRSSSELYVQLLKSRSVADEVIAEQHLDQVYRTKYPSQTRATLAARTRIDLSDKSGLITLAVTDGSAQRAADIANGYVRAYRKLSAHLAVSEAARRRAFFDTQLVDAKNNLASAEEKLALTRQQTGLVQPEGQAQALIGSAANLRAQVAAKHVQVEAMREYATPENPQMKQAQTELAGLEGQLAVLERSHAQDPGALIQSKNTMEHGGLEYVRRMRDVRYYETIYDTLARQLETARLEEAREGNGIQVVDAAIPPDGKSGPRRKLIVLGSLVLGLVLGCVWVLGRVGLREYRARGRLVAHGV